MGTENPGRPNLAPTPLRPFSPSPPIPPPQNQNQQPPPPPPSFFRPTSTAPTQTPPTGFTDPSSLHQRPPPLQQRFIPSSTPQPQPPSLTRRPPPQPHLGFPSTNLPTTPSLNLCPPPPPPPPSDSSFSGSRSPALPGFPSIPQPPSPVQSSFAQRPPYGAAPPPPPPPSHSHQLPPYGYGDTPAAAAVIPGLHSREQPPPPYGSAPPPTAPIQGLLEDFSFLSIASVPGSIDPGIDANALPRPLDGDVEPHSFQEMYPMNCRSRYLRLTTSAIPSSQSLLSRWQLPLGAVVCPLAESPKGEEVPIVNFASTGIIRCRRCRTYINPYATFTDSGRKWRCNICTLLNDVPGEYFAHLDANGKRIDLDQRPELSSGSVEFVAPTEYMVRPPMPPLYFFLIDVSLSAVRSGMLEVVAETIRSCLNDLPGCPRTQIGFITFDSTIHFYNMKSSLTQPQMMVVSDLDEIFVPLPDDLLVNLSESKTVVEAFLDSLPSMFQDNANIESAFGPAVKAAYMIMSQLGGKLLVFQNAMPSLGVGRLRLRGDDPRVYGTDKEHALRVPEDPFYKQMAADFTKFQIGVNIYAFSDKYTDIASLGTLAKYTGGQVYYYPGFQSSIHKEKLRHELSRDLTRETAWEAVMRIRCGKGVRFTTFHGNFMLRSTDLLALPAVDCDKAFAMQLSLEETLLTTQTVYFQVALLYTSSSGERRIRVHTAAAPVVTELGEMYRHADTGAIVSLLCRLAIEKSLSHKLDDARNFVQLRIVKALREYRNLYAVQHRLGGRMIYPESLKLLPLYGLALCKSTPLRIGYADVPLDERCAAGYTMMALPVKRLLKLLYPSLIRGDEFLSKVSAQPDELKNTLRRSALSIESLDSRGLYIYDDGFRFVIWFGRMLPPDITMNILGVDFAVDLSKVSLSDRGNEMYRRLMTILNKFRGEDPSYHQLSYLVRQGEQPREGLLLLGNLVEDQTGSTSGYVDWMLQIHRQVQQNA